MVPIYKRTNPFFYLLCEISPSDPHYYFCQSSLLPDARHRGRRLSLPSSSCTGTVGDQCIDPAPPVPTPVRDLYWGSGAPRNPYRSGCTSDPRLRARFVQTDRHVWTRVHGHCPCGRSRRDTLGDPNLGQETPRDLFSDET